MYRHIVHIRRVTCAGICLGAYLLFFWVAPWVHMHADEDHGEVNGRTHHLHFTTLLEGVEVGASGQLSGRGTGSVEPSAAQWAFHLLSTGTALSGQYEFSRSIRVALGSQLAGTSVLVGLLLLPLFKPPATSFPLVPPPQKSLSSRERTLLLGTSLPPPSA